MFSCHHCRPESSIGQDSGIVCAQDNNALSVRENEREDSRESERGRVRGLKEGRILMKMEPRVAILSMIMKESNGNGSAFIIQEDTDHLHHEARFI